MPQIQPPKARKPYKKQTDRLLKQLHGPERRYQTMLRTRIMAELDYLVA